VQPERFFEQALSRIHALDWPAKRERREATGGGSALKLGSIFTK
jgi:hypothetical protein